MPFRAEVQRRAAHLSRSVKAGLSPLWFVLTAAVALVGGSAALAALWGARHLVWGLVIFLVILVIVVTEGSYRAATDRETKRSGRVAELEDERDAKANELEVVRAELKEVKRAAITALAGPRAATVQAALLHDQIARVRRLHHLVLRRRHQSARRARAHSTHVREAHGPSPAPEPAIRRHARVPVRRPAGGRGRAHGWASNSTRTGGTLTHWQHRDRQRRQDQRLQVLPGSGRGLGTRS